MEDPSHAPATLLRTSHPLSEPALAVLTQNTPTGMESEAVTSIIRVHTITTRKCYAYATNQEPWTGARDEIQSGRMGMENDTRVSMLQSVPEYTRQQRAPSTRAHEARLLILEGTH